MERKSSGLLLASVILAIALLGAAWMVSGGLKSFRKYDRVVTTKGLAERDVEANVGRWRLLLTIPGNDLAAVQQEVDSKFGRVLAFFREQGFTEQELRPEPPKVVDLFARSYRDPNVAIGGRYIVSEVLIVRSERVLELQRMRGKLAELVREGIPLDDDRGPRYVYTKLNDIKPEMLNKAVVRAREAADQFARLSETQIAGIKSANQGVFQILADEGDELYTIQKKVRVVSTITFFLK